jgi:hypothetical protein
MAFKHLKSHQMSYLSLIPTVTVQLRMARVFKLSAVMTWRNGRSYAWR